MRSNSATLAPPFVRAIASASQSLIIRSTVKGFLLRDGQDQTRIALEVEEAVYDPESNQLFLYTSSETCYVVSKVVKANADSFIEELAAKGYCDLTQFESVQDE